MTIENIQNHPTYKQVVADSFGGVMYDEANRTKYDGAEVIQLWDNLTEGEQQCAGGVMKGALEFLKGE